MPSGPIRYRLSLVVLTLLCSGTVPVRAEGIVDTLVRRFAESDFRFVRAQSNAPFPPLAQVAASGYQQSEFASFDAGAIDVSFEQSSISQYALVPVPIGQRDAFAIGEWISWTRFDLDDATRDDFEVLSFAMPIGWVRQASPDWQLAAFIAPFGHYSSQDNWYWETLGGVFARNVRNERLAWIVGAYFDVSPVENFYTPYLGAAFVINERWTLNAIMPWPSITYAPSTDTVFRLGVSPSGASWTAERDGRRPRVSLSAWNFGLGLERRLWKNWWFGLEAGVSGLRGMTLVDSDWQGPETKLDNTGFVLITINLHPDTLD